MRLTDIEQQVRAHTTEVAVATIDELRDRRSSLGSLESQVSFLRRVLQARIDLIETALDARHDAPGADARLSALLGAVPEVMVRSGSCGSGRSPRHRGLVDPDLELLAEVEGDGAIALLDVPAAQDDELRTELVRLDGVERRISDLRQELHDSIDAIQGDIARRYRVGELTVSG
jgi:hypothetical protein